MIDSLRGRDAISAAFYDGPGWVRFRPWERGFLRMVGGEIRARMEILNHLPRADRALVLEVGIGDGENVDLLPEGWRLFGVDLARTQLEVCRRRFPFMTDRLFHAQAAKLPFDDETFDAVFSIGGFNYYDDHAQSLQEMRRVTKRGGTIVAADEAPNLHHYTIGHWIGRPELTAWCLRRVGLDRDFAKMVVETEFDVAKFAREEWPGHARHRIWKRLGYCLVGGR